MLSTHHLSLSLMFGGKGENGAQSGCAQCLALFFEVRVNCQPGRQADWFVADHCLPKIIIHYV